MNLSETIPVTVVVPVRNEEANLARCLERLNRFSEIIVVNSNSTDRTREIARAHGANVLDFSWNGRYPKKRNWLLLNHNLACDWVLFLDADELVTEKFCEAVKDAVSSDHYNGFWLNYTNYFLGKPLHYGLPQRKLALFRVKKGLYERIEEDNWTRLDMEVHEHPIIDGLVGEISTPIDHRDYNRLDRFIDKHQDYALWEAHRYIKLKISEKDDIFTFRQVFKYNNISKWWYPWFYFFFNYIIKFGFADGSTGFYYSLFKFWYFNVIRLHILEINAKCAE